MRQVWRRRWPPKTFIERPRRTQLSVLSLLGEVSLSRYAREGACTFLEWEPEVERVKQQY